MIRADAITLRETTPAAHGVHATVTETSRVIPCEVRSVSRNEAYQAMSAGFRPEYVFRLALAEDYNGEHRLTFREKDYRVIRTYMAGDGIELVAERWQADE